MRLSCERDVDALYVLLLGRLPESEQIYRENLSQTLFEAADAIIEAAEFAEILADFRQHGKLPHEQLSAPVFRQVIGATVEIGLAPPDLLDLYPGFHNAEPLEQRDAAEFLAAAYRIVLRREADPEEQAHYHAALDRGVQSKRQIVEALLGSEEAAALAHASRVVWGSVETADAAESEQGEKPDWFAALAKIFSAEPLNSLLKAYHGAAGREFVGRLHVRCRSCSDPAESEDDAELSLYIDDPEILDGAVALQIQNSLRVGGWARARDGVAVIDVFIDGAPLGPATRGLPRPDVAVEFPEWPDAERSGFVKIIPQRKLPRGHHSVEVVLSDTSGRTRAVEFAVNIAESTTDPLSLRRKIAQSEIDLHHRILAQHKWRPVFCLLLLIGSGEGEIEQARLTLSSLSRQAYSDWRVLVVLRRRSPEPEVLRERLMDGSQTVGTLLSRLHDGHTDPAVLRERLLAGFAEFGGQLEILRHSDGRSLTDLAGSGPALLGLLTAGDELGVDALLEFAVTSALHPEADFLYSDEWRQSPAGGAAEPFLKPQWSPDLLLATNYIGRFWCAAPRLLAESAASLADLLRLGEYDLVLRLTEAAAQTRHVPVLLCRRGPRRLDSTAMEKKALVQAMTRRGIAGAIEDGCVPGTYRLKRALARPGLVSIIICTCAARGLVKTCLETLREITAYRDFEVIIVENVPPAEAQWKEWLRANADRVLTPEEPFNWSRFNNLGAAAASGEYLLFLNDDIEILEEGWLDALLEHVQRPEVGIVGPLLLWPDRTIQSAGVFLTDDVGRGRHAFRNLPEGDPGYFGLALTQRNAIAVLGACLLTRKEVFERLGRFDEGHRIVNNETDYCLRAWQAGLVNVFTPYAKLIHHERASRRDLADDYDAAGFAEQWRGVYADGDPYHHPCLSKDIDQLAPEPEPLRLICAGRPLLRREAVRNILVVKLDHIGDCIIAFAAIRRLKECFPEASLRVLAGGWTHAIWSLPGVVDEVIAFDFFRTRADEGIKDLTEDDLTDLRRRLAPYRFDLAVDLRRHPETRPILQYTGAYVLAGFDQQARFPWLDIALEFEGDPGQAHKHHHESDGLIALVDAICAQCEPERRFAPELPPSPLPLPEATRRRLFCRRLVCIHPAAGDRLRQWPPRHFAELIDLLVEREDVTIALIGSHGDQGIASKTLQLARNRRAVVNLLGRLPLENLPDLLRCSALFVGNNSGPHHLAAGLGVPTIGVHSGLVDAREWGPVGPYAIALQRGMECGPCYLPSPELCPRDLACLTGLRPGEVYRACHRLLALGFGDRPLESLAAPRPRA